MTCINQYTKEHPDATLSEVIKHYCPWEFYNIDENFEGCTDAMYEYGDCERCWNREIPETKETVEDKKENNEMNCTCDVVNMIKQLQFDNDTLLEELKDARERLAEVTECYGESLKERDDLKKKLNNESNLVGIYGAILDTKDTMIKKLNETNEDLANKLAAERAKVETRTEEIDKLVKENERLNEDVINLTKADEVNVDTIRMLRDRIDKMDEERYIEHDLEMAKKVAEHYKSLVETSPIVLTKSEESTIRPFNELPYVRYARHIHMKYKALTDSGFSHDDAMGLIPMWDDNEFEGFKRMEE